MSKPTTYITFLLDRTGSMASIWPATVDGFNEFVNGQKTSGVKGKMTLTVFDSQSIDVAYTHKLADVPVLTVETYTPRAMTPLYDAIGRTINDAKTYLAGRDTQPDTVIAVIMTDGLENHSREFSLTAVRELIKAQEEAGWKFVFLGANMDAHIEGQNLGMTNAAYVTYSSTPASAQSSMGYASATVSRTAASKGASWDSTVIDVDEEGTVKKRKEKTP